MITPTKNPEELFKVAHEFWELLNSLAGFYHDSRNGFHLLRSCIEDEQKKDIASKAGGQDHFRVPEDLDHHLETIGSTQGDVIHHVCTKGERKERNSSGGANEKSLARYCFVLLFEYWESEYRTRLATCAGISKDQLKEDLFGDLRKLRNAILHKRGLGNEECERLSVLQSKKRNEEITFSMDEFHDLLAKVRQFLEQFVLTHSGERRSYSPNREDIVLRAQTGHIKVRLGRPIER